MATTTKLETRAGAATTVVVTLAVYGSIGVDAFYGSRMVHLLPGLVPVALYAFVAARVACVAGYSIGLLVDAWVLAGLDMAELRERRRARAGQ